MSCVRAAFDALEAREASGLFGEEVSIKRGDLGRREGIYQEGRGEKASIKREEASGTVATGLTPLDVYCYIDVFQVHARWTSCIGE